MTKNNTTNLNFLQQLHVPIPERRIFSRLGFNHYKTSVDDKELIKYKLQINAAFSHCHIQGVWFQSNIRKCCTETGQIILDCGIIFYSKDLAKLLKNSESVALLAATVGKNIVHARDSLIVKKDSAAALIYDAVGSEVVDEAMNLIQKIISQEISRTSRKLTKMRFSVGYGDLELSNQQQFYEYLQLDKLNISLSDNYIMTPEKSVTAIIGIEQ